ncbi:MAG: class I mannose-6-phosphate isomerase [Acidobacteria bacterium]|nr:class I mannose-6-phosphate isomerase [Acidobacteriota bacterium]
MTAAIPIAPSFHEKAWGSTGLAPWFPNPENRTGEVWFEAESLPLIKFLFTTERLSVQVHPDDDYAREHENSNGKTEMWHILRVAPGAQVAIGFREPVTLEDMRGAAENGTIEALLNWIAVRPGDTLFIPAGTVHSIGAGMALCEIQQHSDITYRIYDYGRPRELHLDQALAVSQLGSCPGRSTLPVCCPHFYTHRLQLQEKLALEPLDRPSALIVLSGEGLIGQEPFLPGAVWEIPPARAVNLAGQGVLLRTYIP